MVALKQFIWFILPFMPYYHKLRTPNRLSSWLEKTKLPLHQLHEHLLQNIKLNQLVQPIVKEQSSVDVTVTRYERGILDLCVTDQSTANHLQYLSAVIIEELKTFEIFEQLTHITTFVIHHDRVNWKNNTTASSETTNQKPIINSHTQSMMQSIADNYIQHSNLKQELKTLAHLLTHNVTESYNDETS